LNALAGKQVVIAVFPLSCYGEANHFVISARKTEDIDVHTNPVKSLLQIPQ